MDIGDLNLWNPHAGIGVGLALLTAFMLGLIHGITPDEHTWPITFSYSVGSYSARGGMRAGLMFSAAFTLQRSIASEIAYLGLSAFERLIRTPHYEAYLSLLVGAVMMISGYYVLRRGTILHLFHRHGIDESRAAPAPVSGWMPLVHGFIAGWGSGAFALITYTVLAPAMPNAYLGFLPGLLFGLGTMAMQMLFGAAFGAWMAGRDLGEQARAYVARSVAGRTLAWGGSAFVLVGTATLIFPGLETTGVDTGLHIHNLAHLGIDFVLAVAVLLVVACYAFWRALRDVSEGRLPRADATR